MITTILRANPPGPSSVDAAPSLAASRCVVIAVASDELDDVLIRAGARARRWGLPLRLCVAVDTRQDRVAIVRDLAHRVRRLWPLDGAAVIDLRVGDPAEQILACAEQHHAALLVLGPAAHRQGLFGRIFAPSVPTSVLRAATCPIVLSRGAVDSPDILVATGLDDPTWPELCAAATEAVRTGGRVTALHCIEPVSALPPSDVLSLQPRRIDETEAVAMAHLERGAALAGLVNAELRVEVATPSAAILAHARTLGVGLLIVGTHGRRGAQRLLLGSTAEHVARDAPCDVMVVRLPKPTLIA